MGIFPLTEISLISEKEWLIFHHASSELDRLFFSQKKSQEVLECFGFWFSYEKAIFSYAFVHNIRGHNISILRYLRNKSDWAGNGND